VGSETGKLGGKRGRTVLGNAVYEGGIAKKTGHRIRGEESHAPEESFRNIFGDSEFGSIGRTERPSNASEG